MLPSWNYVQLFSLTIQLTINFICSVSMCVSVKRKGEERWDILCLQKLSPRNGGISCHREMGGELTLRKGVSRYLWAPIWPLTLTTDTGKPLIVAKCHVSSQVCPASHLSPANIARQPSLSWTGRLNTEVNAPGSVLNSHDASDNYVFRSVNLHT